MFLGLFFQAMGSIFFLNRYCHQTLPLRLFFHPFCVFSNDTIYTYPRALDSNDAFAKLGVWSLHISSFSSPKGNTVERNCGDKKDNCKNFPLVLARHLCPCRFLFLFPKYCTAYEGISSHPISSSQGANTEVSYLSPCTGSRTIRDSAAQFAIGLGLMVFGFDWVLFLVLWFHWKAAWWRYLIYFATTE